MNIGNQLFHPMTNYVHEMSMKNQEISFDSIVKRNSKETVMRNSLSHFHSSMEYLENLLKMFDFHMNESSVHVPYALQWLVIDQVKLDLNKSIE